METERFEWVTHKQEKSPLCLLTLDNLTPLELGKTVPDETICFRMLDSESLVVLASEFKRV